MKSNLANFTDIHIKLQSVRVATGNRLAHLEKQGRNDDRTKEIYDRALNLEELVEGYIADEFQGHPTFPWCSRIKGCGKEAAAKPIGIIEGVTFSHALLSDLRSIGVTITMEELKDNRIDLERSYPELFQRRSSIQAFGTPSQLRRFEGLAPLNGKTERVAKGEKGLHYNPELRMMLWRLLTSLMRSRGVWYDKYTENDDGYMNRFNRDGIKVVPTPEGRYCLVCQEEKQVPKTTKYCPDCEEKLVGKKEPPGVIYRGHAVNMAKRRTIRLWGDCLWLVWRVALDLPIRTPYIVKYGGHHLIDPWEMVDKKEGREDEELYQKWLKAKKKLSQV